MRTTERDPVLVLEELAERVAARGRSALNTWQFVAVMLRVARERPDYLDTMSPADRQLFDDAKDSPLAGFSGPIQ